MNTPPLLLFAALTFWGWQSECLVAGVLAGAALEISRVLPLRWELEDVDFNRVFSLCVLVTVALFGYLFTAGDPGNGGGMHEMFNGPAGFHNASNDLVQAAHTVWRWLPMIALPFMAAQAYNARPSVPLTAVSMVLRIRRRRGEQSLAGRYLDVSYGYFILCVFSAGIHANHATHSYFWGQAVLILWALWQRRTGRFGWKVWAGGLAVVLALGCLGEAGIGAVEGLVQTFDTEFLARLFHSRTDPSRSVTAIGQIGELKLSPRIVVRLEPSRLGLAPTYLREASYRLYSPHNETWLAGIPANSFTAMQAQPDNNTWVLVPGKITHNTVNISCYLEGRSEGVPEGVLPLPSGTCRVENLSALVNVLKTNANGVLLASGPGLAVFDARYGPGATLDTPPGVDTNRTDLAVPDTEAPALDQVIAEMHVTATNDLDKRLAVAAFFMRNFTYSTWQGPEKRSLTNASPLTRFLLNSRSGHCEYFATATVLLMRELGIPARYAVGYYVHETSGSGYVVRERDAHAWCLVWNRQSKTWEDFDTTPPSWLAAENRHDAFGDLLSDARSWLVFQFEKLRWQQAQLRQYIIWTLSPVIVVLLYYIFFQRRAKKRAAVAKTGPEAPVIWPGHDSAFYRLEKMLAARGLPRQPQETLSDWLERALAEPALAGLRIPLRDLLQLHYRYRFDPRGLEDGEKASFGQTADSVLGKLSQMKTAN